MKRRTVIFEKDSMLGCISIADDGEQAHVGSFDSRCGVKDARALLPSGMVAGVVAGELGKTVERGWRIIFDGEPNFG